MYLPDAVPIPWRALAFGERLALRAAPWAGTLRELRVSKSAPTARLVALGDLVLSAVGDVDARGVFGPLGERLEAADLVTGNLEAAPTRKSDPSGRIGSFIRARPEAVRVLAAGHVDVVNLANNHALDFGPQALAEATELLRDAGIATCGVRRNGKAATLAVREANGLRVGFLGACDDHFVPSPADEQRCGLESDEALEESIERARAEVDILIVHLHWGYEFTLHPLLTHRNRARRFAELGAHLVLCHHAHVAQGVEQWRNAVIAYGLGNAVTPLSRYMRAGHPWTDRSFALEADFGRDGIAAVRLIPFGLQADGSMSALPRRQAHDLLAGVARASQRLVDESFLARLERARMVFELVRLAAAVRDAASAPGTALAERGRSLRLVRQRRLLAAACALDGVAAAARSLGRLAAAADDHLALRDAYDESRASLDAALAGFSRDYAWRDALRSRLP